MFVVIISRQNDNFETASCVRTYVCLYVSTLQYSIVVSHCMIQQKVYSVGVFSTRVGVVNDIICKEIIQSSFSLHL